MAAIKSASFVGKLIKKLKQVDQIEVEKYIAGLHARHELLAEILDRLQEGVFLTDCQGRIVLMNVRAQLWLGFGSEAEAKVPGGLEWCRDKSLAEFWKEAIRGEGDNLVADLKMLYPRERDVRCFVVRLGDAIEYFLGLLVDRGEECGRSFDREQMARIESLVRLAAGVAHEIGNPLNAIGIHLGLLRQEAEKLPDEPAGKILDRIEIITAETRRLDRIVRDFLKATRRPPLRFKTEDLNQILAEVIRFWEPEAAAYGISLLFSEAPGLIPFLLDRGRIHDAFMNLLKNAIEAMPDGGRIEVQIRVQDRSALVRIRDEGKGIPEEDHDRIFDPYFTTKENGSGLGLMMVHQAVMDHGGRIRVQSHGNRGTSFEIELPLRGQKLQLPDYGTEKDKG